MTTLGTVELRADPRHEAPTFGGGAVGIETPEFLLLAACCRWPLSEVHDANIRDAVVSVSDWDRFLTLVNRHRVAGLVYQALSIAKASLPSAAADVLAGQARRVARRNSVLSAEAMRLQRTLDAADVPCLMLKGVALAKLAYGSLHTKHARDIDLLVAPDRAEVAMRILEREGYALYYPAKHLSDVQRRAVFRSAREMQFVRPSDKLLVEIQWRASSNPLLLKGVNARSATQRVSLSGGGSVSTLASDDLFAYLCVHGAQHAWSRLKWLADFNAYASADTEAIVRCYRHAQEIGAGRCAGQALLLCRRLFGLTLPDTLASELERDGTVQRLAAIALLTLADEFAESETGRGVFSKMRVIRGQFLLGRGLAFLIAQWQIEAVRLGDVVEVPLPASLSFLYPLLRIPLWLWRRIKSTVPR